MEEIGHGLGYRDSGVVESAEELGLAEAQLVGVDDRRN